MSSHRQQFLNHIAQTSPAPMMMEVASANGVFIKDVQGQTYYDLISGVNVSALGHNHPEIISAVKAQVDQHMHVMVYGEFIQSSQLDYALLLTENLPDSLSSVYYVNSGAEAVEGALKLAKKYTGRSKIFSFKNAYHGSTHAAMSLMSSEKYKKGFFPLIPGVNYLEYNNFEDLEKIDTSTACVVAEVMQAEAGMILPVKGFLRALRDRCNETGTLLIFDEIQTGIGRMGCTFGFECFGVIPDILLLAKSFGGGMPLGAFIASREMMEVLAYNPALGHITTFGGHPVACAAGKAGFEYILNNGLAELTFQKEAVFRESLVHESIREIRGQGLMLAVELGHRDLMLKVVDQGMKLGFITDWFLFCETAIRISPPLNISNEEILGVSKLILEAIDNAVHQ